MFKVWFLVGARHRLGYEVEKLLTMSLYFTFLSLKLKLNLPPQG